MIKIFVADHSKVKGVNKIEQTTEPIKMVQTTEPNKMVQTALTLLKVKNNKIK